MKGHVLTILPSFLTVVVRRVPLLRFVDDVSLPHDGSAYKLRDGNFNRVTDAQHVECDRSTTQIRSHKSRA